MKRGARSAFLPICARFTSPRAPIGSCVHHNAPGGRGPVGRICATSCAGCIYPGQGREWQLWNGNPTMATAVGTGLSCCRHNHRRHRTSCRHRTRSAHHRRTSDGRPRGDHHPHRCPRCRPTNWRRCHRPWSCCHSRCGASPAWGAGTRWRRAVMPRKSPRGPRPRRLSGRRSFFPPRFLFRATVMPPPAPAESRVEEVQRFGATDQPGHRLRSRVARATPSQWRG